MTTENIRVLVVDDDAGARALHGRFVATAPGFTVVSTVGTGEDAVRRIRAGGIDLVLLDMRLPDISGIEVLRRVRALDAPAPDIFIISSARDQLTVRQALAAHIDGYLIKPFTREALRDRLTLYRDERRARERDLCEHALSQGEIDRLLSAGQLGHVRSTADFAAEPGTGGHPVSPQHTSSPLPKGLSALTLLKVREALDPLTARTAVEVAGLCGISRATARRYLDFLVGDGAIDLAHRYGRRGRPEVLYRLAIRS